MIELRPFSGLGGMSTGWLDTRHHFSFGGYYHDPQRMGWGALRVWNDDLISPGQGFGMHPHKDMEIITYVIDGAISHRDSQGNEGRTAAGDVQVMSAGTGIRHSEHNKEDEVTHIFQLWIEPDAEGHTPRWDTASFPKEPTGLVALASGRAGHAQALPIHQDAVVFGANMSKDQTVVHELGKRMAYIVPAKGSVSINGTVVGERDGAAVKDVETLIIEALDDTRLLLVDLP